MEQKEPKFFWLRLFAIWAALCITWAMIKSPDIKDVFLYIFFLVIALYMGGSTLREHLAEWLVRKFK